MTRRRDNLWPLVVSLLLAVAVHLVAAPPAWDWLSRSHQLLAPPDLRVENVVVPHDVLLLKADNAVSFDVVNRGEQPTGDAPWHDRIYLSPDETLDSHDTLLVDVPRVEPLSPGQRYRSGDHVIRVPDAVKPPFYLLLVTDADNRIDERWHEDNNIYVYRFDAPDEPQPHDLAVGKPDAPKRVTAAWISHDDFQKLIAPPSVTEQPALQNAVEPIPGAPVQLDPTPPQVVPQVANEQDRPATPAESGGTLADHPVAVPQKQPGPLAAVAGPHGRPDLQTAPGEGDSAAHASARPDDQPASPTSVPRDEAESEPVQRTQRVDVHPLAGDAVLVGQGITVKPVRPRFSPVARYTAAPTNPEAEITFDHTGKVIDARLTQSSGSDNVDAPILRSLYQWKARGEKIDQLGDGKLIMPVRLILTESDAE